MKEYQRQIVIEQITKNIKEKESLKTKYSQLEELVTDPKIMTYFALLEEIKKIKEKYNNNTTIEAIIEQGFKKYICEDFRCDHDIWLYVGSYYLDIDKYRHEHDHLCRKLDENLNTTEGDFEYKYNEYVCLECGEKIETKEWKNFEQNRFVLKNQSEDIDIGKYISQYYQFLYTMNVKEAQNKVIQAFNIEKTKTKTLNK